MQSFNVGLKLCACQSVWLKRTFCSSATTADFRTEYETLYIQTTRLQKCLLTAGSSIVSLLQPSRGDMIATLGETTGEIALSYMLHKMQSDPEGREILRNKPRINTCTVDLSWLESLPEGTLGRAYSRFLNDNRVTPDSRMTVKFIEDVEKAYVMQRYREAHDLIHTLLNMPTNMLGEVTVKWVEAFQTRLPMCAAGGLFGAVRLSPKQRQKYVTSHLPWAIKTGLNSGFLLNLYFEHRWDQPVEDIHRELNITPLVVT